MTLQARAARPEELSSADRHWHAHYRQHWPQAYRLSYCLCAGDALRARQLAGDAFVAAARQAEGSAFAAHWLEACAALAPPAAQARPADGLLAAALALPRRQQLAFLAADVCRLPPPAAARAAGIPTADFGRVLLAARLALCRPRAAAPPA